MSIPVPTGHRHRYEELHLHSSNANYVAVETLCNGSPPCMLRTVIEVVSVAALPPAAGPGLQGAMASVARRVCAKVVGATPEIGRCY